MEQPTLGVIVGNRGVFPSYLCDSGRKEILQVLEEEGIRAVILSPDATEVGSVMNLADAEKCAALFKAHREEIRGVLVTLPNFGDERSVANTLRYAGLNVPVLVHAFPDDPGRMGTTERRDSFCGKMSVCNNLVQYGIPFSLTRRHTIAPTSEGFRQDLRWFARVCQVAHGLRHARIGAIGARPADFNTVRYSEKLLERAGISVETLDLSELFGWIDRLGDDDAQVRQKRKEVEAYVTTTGVPDLSLHKIAKMGVVIDRWMVERNLQATAVQCWTSMEEFFGVVPCTVMSMMSNRLLPSACETDVAGVVGMVALTLASGEPSALVDWNNNYGEDPDQAVVFHCSNLPKQIFQDIPVMDYQKIVANAVGKENSYGAIHGRIRSKGAFTYCRVSTDDVAGKIRAYVGQGEMSDDPLLTFGGYGVVRIPNLQGLLRHICEMGYEHHTAINLSPVASAVQEAMDKYLGWEVYNHDLATGANIP